MKRKKIETWQNLTGTWTAAYSEWEWETGESEKEAIHNLKEAARRREQRYKNI